MVTSEDFYRIANEMLTSYTNTELQRRSMQRYFSDKTDVVRFAGKAIRNLPVGSQLTITIERDKFADYYATSVITAWSVDTPTPDSSKGLDVT